MYSNRKTNPSSSKPNKQRSNFKSSSSQGDPQEEQLVKDIGDKMIDSFSADQLRCHYHPNKMITNFCEEQQCLLPMCPNCVAIHSDFHKTNKSQGQFRTLDLIIGQLLIQMEDQFKSVKESQDQIRNFEQQIELQPDNLRNQFDQLKRQALSAVEDAFEKLRSKMEEALNNYQNNNENQMAQLDSQLIQYQQTLEEIQEDLKDDPLPTIVKLKSESTLSRLVSQMPDPQPLVNQISSQMISLVPDSQAVYSQVHSILNSTLQLKSREQNHSATVKPNALPQPQHNPKSHSYLQYNHPPAVMSNQITHGQPMATKPTFSTNPVPSSQLPPQQIFQPSPNKFLNPPPPSMHNRSMTPSKIIVSPPGGPYEPPQGHSSLPNGQTQQNGFPPRYLHR